MVKLADARRKLIWSGDPYSYDARYDSNGDGYSATIDLHQKWRYKEANKNCQDNGYWRKGGSELCTLYITVECGVAEEICAYTLSLQLFEYTQNSRRIGAEVVPSPPMYVPRDQDYVDVTVASNDIKELYFPVKPFEYEDMLIFVNKTAAIGKGASLKVIAAIQPDASVGYQNWYPYQETDEHFTMQSFTQDHIQPEMISIDAATLEERCNTGPNGEVYDKWDNHNEDCIVQIGLIG